MQVRLREKIERKEGNEITDSTEIQEEEYWMMVTCVNGRVKNESEWDLLCLINKKRERLLQWGIIEYDIEHNI